MRIPTCPENHPGRRLAAWILMFVATLMVATTRPTSAGPTDLEARFLDELQQLVTAYDLPGATAACVLPDGSVVSVAAGLADKDAATPMTSASRMLAASVGKTFVAATVVTLAEEGRLDLDDRLTRWLGDRSWFHRLPNADTITLRHLLRHESGLPDHVHDAAFMQAWRDGRREGGQVLTPDELVAIVLDQRPLFAAGDGWSYSDTGYILLGMVIEAATGERYGDLVTRRFLAPLALTATTPSDRLDLPGLATGYLAEDNPFGLPSATTDEHGVMVWHPGIEWTGGGLASNSRDLAVWAAALFGGRAWPTPYLDTLLDSVTIDESASYGLGVAIHTMGPAGPSLGHAGWIPGYVTSVRFYPVHGVAVAFQINTDAGLDDRERPVVLDMEQRLSALAVNGTTPGNRAR